MSAEPSRVAKPEAWAGWENHVVNGVFPLRRFLGGSTRSAVFLTEHKENNLPNAAIKFVPADGLHADAQLVQWGAAATYSHPHLIRLFDVGRYQFGGRSFLFVVMEFAAQTLAQILPHRALSSDEVREMLAPTLGVLDFLHQKQLVQGQLKPSNFLVVGDQLKLASDTVRPIGSSTGGVVRTSFYDPPEFEDGRVSVAGDVWGLGVTLVEALTQYIPEWTEQYELAAWAADFPAAFADPVRRCLSPLAANRPTIAELKTLYAPAQPQERAAAISEPPLHEARREASPSQNFHKRQLWLIGAATILISLAVWVVLRSSRNQSNSRGSPAVTVPAHVQSGDAATQARGAATQARGAPTQVRGAAQQSVSAPAIDARAAPGPTVPPAVPPPVAAADAGTSSQPASDLADSVSSPPEQPAPPPPNASASVLHEVSPDVPQAIRAKIHGHVNVRVRVLVDPSGTVVGEFLEHPGPSRYFARIAGDAAEEWKFAPADTRGPRVWLLHFEFTRAGVTVQATAAD